MAMLHSFWQAALLLLLYITVDKIVHKNNAPLAKRNFLYAAIVTQLILFLLTFSIHFFDTAGLGKLTGITQNITGYISSENMQSITPWIFGLYIFIIAYKLMKAIYSWYLFKQQYKTGLQRPSVDLKLFTELKANQFGIKRKVKLWLSSSVQTPITFGFFKPVILLPVALLNNISTKQAETLILHELTHIRTNDYLLNWFLLTAETIFFFNPFVISLCKRIKLEREKNCDIHVMAFEYSPALYAETLLLAERMKQLVPNFQLAAVNRKKHLLQRIQFFTSDKILKQPLRFNIVAPLIGLVLLLMLSTAVLFQSGRSVLPLQSAAGIHYLPVSNYIIQDAEYNRQIIPGNRATETMAEQIESQQPLIENKIELKPEPVSKPEIQFIEEITKPVDVNYALPVSSTENDAARQIIIKEEGSGSASVKVYYLSFENGKWILQPEWIITANEIMIDSLSRKIDTLKNSIKLLYPAQQ
jgi:beta-lactamase regulating signal transducer with metallopeptidase domain